MTGGQGTVVRRGPVAARPRTAALVGATFIAFSGIFFRLSEQSPSTATVFRCLFALPFLAVLAVHERRAAPRPDRRQRAMILLAGACFAIDLLAWQHAVLLVGAGLATVVANFQVLIVAAASWLLLDERPDGRFLAGLPLVLLGAVLISGVLDASAYGSDPVLGVVFGIVSAIAYSAYLLLIRRANPGGRRTWGSLLEATGASVVVAAVAGAFVGDLVLTPGTSALAWLLVVALTSQVVGYGLINGSLPHLPAAVTSVILLAQPIITLVAAAIILGERPSVIQAAGVAMLLAGVLVAAGPRRRRDAVVAPTLV
jgi:drug/metabolite transporter (DMT)-like permease